MKKPNFKLYACILFMGAGLLSTFQAKAQQGIDHMAQVMTDSLSYLALTDQQKASALSLNKTAATSLAEIAKKTKTDTSFHGKAVFQQVIGVMKQRNAALVKILTPDQQKIFNEHKVQQLADLQTRMMKAQLDLTEGQIPQVYDVNLKSTRILMEDMKKLQAASGKLKKMSAANSLKSHGKDKDKAMKKILSPDQYAVYEKNKEAQQAAIKEKMEQKKKAA